MSILGILGVIFLFANTLYWHKILVAVDRIPDSQPSTESNRSDVALLIVARNELPNLSRNLSYWTDQINCDLKVYLADDGSTDGTKEWMAQQNIFNLHYRYFEKGGPGKKGTLGRALTWVDAPVVILTDADCQPSSMQWAKIMSDPLIANKKDITIGYGPMFKSDISVSRLARFETFFTALQYISWAEWGRPYMGVGRNVAYRSEVLESFADWSKADMASGDDDLFLQRAMQAFSYQIVLHPDAYVFSEAPSTWRDWIRQKARHASTSYYYDLKIQVGLGLVALTTLLWPLIFCLPVWMSLSLLLMRYLWLGTVGHKVWDRLQVDDLFWLWPILDMLMTTYYLLLLPISFFKDKKTWS